MIGSTTGMTYLCAAALLVVAVAAGAQVWTHWYTHRSRSRCPKPNTTEAAQNYRSDLVAATRAGGSRRDWDCSVRLALADLVESALVARTPGERDPQRATQHYRGDELCQHTTRATARPETEPC